jgi:hypothetical protein
VADDRPGITPADDPYEFDWPDDAKDARAAERAAAAAKVEVKPAPLLLTALVIGIGMVLVFILPVSIVAGAITFWIAMAAPVVLGGLVLGLLPAVLLERVSRGWRRGLPEIAFVAVGFLVGFGWTWLAVAAFDGASAFGIRAAVFMGTAVAAGYLAARQWTDAFRLYPRYVYTLAGLIGLLTLASIVNFILFNVG